MTPDELDTLRLFAEAVKVLEATIARSYSFPSFSMADHNWSVASALYQFQLRVVPTDLRAL